MTDEVWSSDRIKERIKATEDIAAAEIRRLDALLDAQAKVVTLLREQAQIAQDKFERTVRDGFVKQNEFRGALEDMSKTMATRRELESFKDGFYRTLVAVISLVIAAATTLVLVLR